jgi:putative hydrolase of the HAD superfamily
VLVFDLDDTLYEELTYVHSGFRAVAAFLAVQFGGDTEELAAEMIAEEAARGRGAVFDAVLRRHGWFSQRLRRQCLTVYRGHAPALQLHPDAERCLRRFAAHPLYVLTDGNKLVQARKAAALGLFGRVRHVYVTHRYGLQRAKPDPELFQRIARREGVAPGQVVYVGDNVRKDFVGIRPLGFRTVRVRRGNYAHYVPTTAGHEADVQVDSLDELTPELLRTLTGPPPA